MKKLVFSTILMLLCFGLYAGTYQVREISDLQTTNQIRNDEEIFYIQDFEDGWSGWETWDSTEPINNWHLTDWNAYGDEGYSWWMGDPDLGGYYNSQYLVLDTPEITVPAGGELSFMMRYNIEAPDPDMPDDYDGWDAFNIRLSTDGGTTWTVIHGMPEYTSSSMYSFGHEHGEGPGVPGWSGILDWTEATFDLSAYSGQDVRIRFAFASDPGYDTHNDPEMFGAMIDNISLGSFVHDFNDGNTQGMIASSMVPVAGDLWHIDESPDAPSPIHVAKCQNDQGSYDFGIFNYLISPTITLPAASQIRVDFQLKGNLYYVQGINNFDYFGFEVSPDAGDTWYAMSNPYNTPGVPNYIYVFSQGVDNFMFMSSLFTMDGLICDYAEHDVKFRIFVRSRYPEPQGMGLFVDDFTIYYTQDLPPPVNLAAEQVDNSVHLQWDSPVAFTQEFLTSTNTSWTSYINDGQPYAMKITNPHDEEHLLGSVSFMLYKADVEYVDGTATVYVWEDNNGLPGAEILAIDDITDIPSMAWKQVFIHDHNIMLSPQESIFVGVGNFETANQGLLADNSSAVCNSYAFIQGAWMPINEAYTGGDQPLMNHGIGGSLFIPEDEAIIPDWYVVYRSTNPGSNYQEIGTTIDNNFIDDAPDFGSMNYYVVTALYEDLGESTYSNQASLFVLPDYYAELHYDDGFADSGLTVGVQNHYAVQFLPEYLPNSNFLFVKIYVYQRNPSGMIFKVWNNNNNEPGDLLAQFQIPANQIFQGWNYFAVPPANPIYLPEGGFFVGVMELQNASLVGLDHNNTGSSFKQIGGTPWQEITEGNVMIRAIIDTTTDTFEELIPGSQRVSVVNYPNPFNPETTIRLNLPQSSDVSLKIFNVKGQTVKILHRGELEAGSHSFVWNGNDETGSKSASGIYFYRLETEDKTITNKMLLLK